MSMNKPVSPAKLEAVEEVKELAEKYRVVGFVKMAKIGAKQIMDLRAKLRGIAKIKMVKKTIIERALKKVSGKPGIEKLLDAYEPRIGPSALIFTNERSLTLKGLLEENKTSRRGKPGETVDKEVIVPAGNTKIPPGPVISELSSVGLPTRIQEGTIWIMKDTPVLKPGDVIDVKMAAVLARLNIEPIDIVLDLYSAYEDGEILDESILSINLEDYKQRLLSAYSDALKLSVELGVVTPENVELILVRAFTRARALAIELPIIIPELMKDYLIQANLKAIALNAAVSGEPITAPAPATAKEDKKPPKEDKVEEVKEEENEDLGLGDLFG
ncbi:MAG: 50S ribosomal protein L10 [Promethearchaeota archaeon]